jgi:tetratricopeptide (TPR) repeat protein
MRRRIRFVSNWLVALAVVLGAAAASAAPAASLGDVDFGVSCAEEVREDFDRAIGFLHHMMYVEARAAFEAIAAKDPACGMARFGVAATLFQPLWPTRPTPEELARGRAEVAKAKALGTGSDVERDLLSAVEAFFRDESADWWSRLRAWAAAMETAYAAHPEHHDTAAFYALSRLAIAPVAKDRAVENARAAEVLLAIHAKSPRHPGAVHYTIHANDVDGRAAESLEIVRSYDDIAPSVPHALHMPTHLFVRLGDWPGVIEWNRKSADAALRFPAGNAVSHHFAHAADYLVYAHLQRGEDDRAKAVLEETLAKDAHQPSFMSAFHLAAIPARYAVERRAWSEAAAIEPRMPASLPWDSYGWAESLSWFARGLGAAHEGDLEKAREAEARMAAIETAAAAAGEKDFARYVEIDRKILAGRIARRSGEDDEAVALTREAVALERTVEKHPVTPGAILPPGEALGDLLLELGRPAEALAAYAASETIWPKRYRTLLGASRAARAAGDETTARRFAEELAAVAPHSKRVKVATLGD